jgi:FkbM family methyltransferase
MLLHTPPHRHSRLSSELSGSNFLKLRKSKPDVLGPGLLSKALLRFVARIAPTAFRELASAQFHVPAPEVGLLALRDKGFFPSRIVDVGAYEGSFTCMAKYIWPEASVLMVEPNRAKAPALNSTSRKFGVDYCDELLGAEDGVEVTFNLLETGSGVFGERSDVERTAETRTLSTLDHVAGPERVDFLKIDTQGYELEVLHGAKRVLSQAEVVLLEISLIEINEGAPIADEVIAFMKRAGFVLYDICEFHRRPLDKALWQIDGLFVQNDSRLRANKTFNIRQ